MIPFLFGSGIITNTKIAIVMFNGIMAVFLIFGSTLKIFQEQKRVFSYVKQTTLFLCLPLSSIYLLFSSTENGLHMVALGMSFFIIMLIAADKHREKTLFFCLAVFLVALSFAIKAKLTIVWPSIFCWWHIFYILGFLAVILLIRSSMHTLALEKEKAILTERYTLARSISHDIMTPIMVMRMLLKKSSNDINEKERMLMLDTLKEMGTIVDSIIPDKHKEFKKLNLENLNIIIQKCISTVCFLHKNLVIHFNTTEEVFARVDSTSLVRILTNILNAGYQLFSKAEREMSVNICKDTYANIQIDIITSPDIPFDRLYDSIERNEILIQEIGLGLSINDLHKIIKNWHGQLLVKNSDEEKYLFRIVLPNENNSDIIGYETLEDDI